MHRGVGGIFLRLDPPVLKDLTVDRLGDHPGQDFDVRSHDLEALTRPKGEPLEVKLFARDSFFLEL